MRLLHEMLPPHHTDLGDVTVVEFQAFREIFRQHWPRADVMLCTPDGTQIRRVVMATVDDAEAARLYRSVLSGHLVDGETGLTWLALADRRVQRFVKRIDR